MVKLLLESGAGSEAKDRTGKTPDQYATAEETKKAHRAELLKPRVKTLGKSASS